MRRVRQINDSGHGACDLTESGLFVGRSGLLRWDIDDALEIEIAYLFDKGYWGRGYGAEAAIRLVDYAFETLGLTRVIALVDPDHEASLRTARRAGLVPEREIEMDGLPTVVLARGRAYPELPEADL